MIITHVNTQTANRVEIQDSNGNVQAVWKSDGTVWRQGEKIGKAENLGEFYLIAGYIPELLKRQNRRSS